MDNAILNQNIHFKCLVLICCKTSDTALLFLVIQQPSIGVAFVVVVLGLCKELLCGTEF